MKGNLFHRIANNRGQFLFGVVQLIAAVALTVFVHPVLHPVAVSSKVIFTWSCIGNFAQKNWLAELVAEVAKDALLLPVIGTYLMASVET